MAAENIRVAALTCRLGNVDAVGPKPSEWFEGSGWREAG